jgi:dipeptidyl aminopeptidase/acylaminoacyl peptidase
MRKAPLLFTLLILVSAVAQTASLTGNVVTDPAKIESRQKFDVQPFTIDKLYMTHDVSDSTLSPDGKQIAFVTNISGRYNLWLVSAESGWPTQLTVSNQRQTSPAWSPTGTWIAYASDYDGDEQWDLFLVSPKNGQVVNLTNTPEVSEENPVWSPDGNTLAYIVKRKDSPSYEINLMDIGSRKITRLTSNTPAELGNFGPVWSKDSKRIVFTQANAAGKDSNILIADVSTQKAISLTQHEGEHNFSVSDISPDGKTLLITSNSSNGYDNIALLDIASRKITWLTRDQWESSAGKFSPDGKSVTWTTNIDGNQGIFLHDLSTHTSRALPLEKGINDLAGGAQGPFTRDGARLLFYHNGPGSPQDVWLYDFAGKKSRQITHALAAGIHADDMAEPYLVHYPSKDGKWQISAFLYVPYNAVRNGQNAAVVSIHGGPTAQFGNSFHRDIQYLVNQGYFVIAPNYRGSSGYGKDFMDANRFDMGGGDLDDVISAAEWIQRTGFIDPKKVAVTGGSYGGYLTMMAVTKAPDVWAAGVPVVPFVNWFTEVENEDPLLRQYDLATMGDPAKDKARYQERSPVNFADQIKAPLLLLAGGHDPRCPSTEAEQVASAVRKRKGVIELKVYDNEGHGFAKIENQIDAATRVAEFLQKYAKPADCGCHVDR